MTESAELLKGYVETGSDHAFGRLVAGHFDLVYSAALRVVNGDAHLAKDVAQTVFTDLALRAKKLPPNVFLSGWLYRHTCFTASKAVRTERRRQARERQAVEMNAQTDPSAAVWNQLAPVLEEAMSQLGDGDRDAIVMRYFEHRPFREMGDTLGTSEDGARKRVERALEKLRGYFGRRGVTISAAVLAGALDGQAVTVAPAGLAAVVSTASLAGAAAGGGAILSITKIMAITKLKIAAAVVAAGMATAIVIQSQTSARLRSENQALHDQLAQLDDLRAQNEQLTKEQANLRAQVMSDKDKSELLRLRSEVGTLRKQVTEAGKALDAMRTREANRAARDKNGSDAQPSSEEDPARQEAMARLTYTKQWVLAFLIHADQHNEQYPTNFDQALPYLPDEAKAQTNLTAEQFELMFQGNLRSIAKPSEVIVIRERQARQTPDGGWTKAYGFADGHCEIHRAQDGNFDEWEKQRLPQLVVQ